MSTKIESGENGYIEADKLVAVYHPKFIQLNSVLVKKKNISDENIEKLLHSHVELMRLKSYASMLDSTDVDELHRLYAEVEKTFFLQQALWGFPESASFHEFWTMPNCSCNKVDNIQEFHEAIRQSYTDKPFTPRYLFDSNCPVHS